MKPIRRAMLAYIAVALGSLVLAACTIQGDTTNILGPSTATATQGSGSSPAPSGSPSPGACFVETLRVAPFAIECDPGVTVPRNGEGVLPLRCRAVVTATPKDRGGADIPPATHGPIGTWRVINGNVRITDRNDDGSNGFNVNVVPLALGPFEVGVSVCSVAGSYRATVTQ